eukprot:gene4721-5344_t
MGNSACCCRSNKIRNCRSRTKDSVDEENGKDKFSTDHEVRVPVDYPFKIRRPLSISLRSIGSFRIGKQKGSIRKTTSLQSAVAVHMNPEVEILQKDFDKYKAEKTSEISLLSRQCEMTFNENRRLRGELKMFQTTCTKLKNERDRAQMAEKDALERSLAIEAERDKVQRQFKLFRDTKANELQTLLKEKRQLEARLMKYVNIQESESENNGFEFAGEGGDLMGFPTELNNMAGTFDSLSTLETSHSNQMLFKGVEPSQFGIEGQETYMNVNKGDWDSIVQNLVKSLKTSIMSIPESNQYRVYISATEDLEEEVQLLIKKHFPPLMQQCEFEGRFLLPIYIPHEYWNESSEEVDQTDLISKRKELVETCDIFISFLGTSIDDITTEDIKNGMQRKSGINHSIFCVRGNAQKSETKAEIDNELWYEIISGKRIKIIYFEEKSPKVLVVSEVYSVLETIIKTFLTEQTSHNSGKKLFPNDDEEWCVGCGWDAFSDYEQSLALKNFAAEDFDAIAIQQYIDQLDKHVTYDGPAQPLLVTGDSGAGKSFLLARWIQMQQASLHDSKLIYHFVGSKMSFSADVVQVMRRLTVQLMQQLPSTCNPARLEDEFPKWLEKMSARLPNGIIVVIDGADNLMGISSYMKWVVDPLPVGCRLVISVTNDNCPKEWRSWTQLNIQPFTRRETKEFVEMSWRNETISFSPELMNQISTQFNQNALENPMYLTLLTKQLESCNSYQEISSEIAKLHKTTDISDFYLIVIEELESKYGRETIRNVLTHIFLARNGLGESEIIQLFRIPWLVWVDIQKELVHKKICTSLSGFLSLSNQQIRVAVEKYYALYDRETHVVTIRQNLIRFFQAKNVPGQVPFRVADELPWLLVKAGQLQALKDVIGTMCIFVRLYRKGRCAELIGYWQLFDQDLSKMATCYYDFIKFMENDPNFAPKTPMLYDTLGRFLRELGMLSQALRPLERSLELKESSLDPDHPSIGQSFHLLGGLYMHWKKYSTAETMFKQALEIKENAYGPDHPSVAKELDALAVFYLLQERMSVAEPLRKRAAHIYQKFYKMQSSESSLEILKQYAEEISDIATTNVSAEVGKSLNDLGVIFFLQNNYSLAKSFFERALKTRESLFGPDHPDVAQSLHNLAALYNDQKLYKQAETLYGRALAIRSKVFPSHNPSVQSTLRHLAGLFRKQGKYIDAEKLYRQILETRENSLGENHPGVACAMNNLAVLLCQMNKHQDALPLYERAIKLYEEHLGIQHPRVTEILQNMAKLYLDAGDTQEAAKMFKQALDQGRTTYNAPLRLPKRGQPNRGSELESRHKEATSRRSSFSSMVRIPKT